MRWWWCLLHQHYSLLDFYSASSLKQQSVSRHVAPLGQIILIPSQPVFVLTQCLSPLKFESLSWRGVLDTTLCDKVGQWLAIGRLFSQGTPFFSTNKTDHHDITELLLKVALNATAPPPLKFVLASITQMILSYSLCM